MSLITSETTSMDSVSSVEESWKQFNASKSNLQKEFEEHQIRMREIAHLLVQGKALQKSLLHLQKVDSQSQPQETPAPSDQKRCKFDQIAPQDQ